MASFALRAGALYWAPNYISKFSFLDNINNQWLKLTKKSHCRFYFRRRTLTLSFYYGDIICRDSLRASSPIWASETSLARTRERAAKPRGAEERSPSLARSREARFACPNRRACSQANVEIGAIL